MGIQNRGLPTQILIFRFQNVVVFGFWFWVLDYKIDGNGIHRICRNFSFGVLWGGRKCGSRTTMQRVNERIGYKIRFGFGYGFGYGFGLGSEDGCGFEFGYGSGFGLDSG